MAQEPLSGRRSAIRDRRGRVIPSAEPGQLNLVIKEPMGVVGCIVPFNYPLMLLVWKVAPALAAGNTVVIKPASQTPLTTLDLNRVFDHLPKGVVNIITGAGAEVGDALVLHPDVPCIAFTGSTATGQRIYRMGAERIKKLHLELGGSDAAIVCGASRSRVESIVPSVWPRLVKTSVLGRIPISVARKYVRTRMSGYSRCCTRTDTAPDPPRTAWIVSRAVSKSRG